MSHLKYLPILCFSIFFNNLAFAAGDEAGRDSNPWMDALISYLPILVILIIVFVFFRRAFNSSRLKLQQEYLTRSIEHMQRMEELTERLTAAVERNNKEP